MSSKEEDTHINSKKTRKRITGFEQWGGYMAAKKMKLDAQFEGQKTTEQGEETAIFEGVTIFVNGYTNPSADELKRLMCLHGGKYHQYYSTSKTTHVIASNLPSSKMKNLKTQIVVTADWITESLKAGKRLPHQDFLLYTPEAVDKQQRLQVGKFFISEEKSDAATTNEPSTSKKLEPTLLKNSFADEFNNSMDIFMSDSDSIEQLEPILSPESNTLNQISTKDVNHTTNPNVSVSPAKQGVAVKAGHPDFVSEFYNHSRLHHISTAGQELKRYVQHLARNNKEKYFPSRVKLKNFKNMSEENCDSLEDNLFSNSSCKQKAKGDNILMHLDIDCFFVSVGLKKHPNLKGFPVAVTHSKGKRGGPQEGSDVHFEASYYQNESHKKLAGLTSAKDKPSSDAPNERTKVSIYSKEYGSLSEIASCSYEARKAGIRNGMLLGEALRRCPNLKTIPYDFEGYSEVSKQLYDIVASYTLDIEAVSCDELYIDCTELLHDVQLSPYQFASALRAEIEGKTGCTASAGIGNNMLLARLATKIAKPNGQFYVCSSEVEEFMKRQKVNDIPGVGYTTSAKLKHFGVITCEDLQTWSLSKLQQEFGPKIGQSLYNRCRGKDTRTVQLQKDRKSVSAEINYGIRFETIEEAYNFINELAIEVQKRLQNIGCKGKALTLKLMARRPEAPVETAKFMGHGVCDHFSKSIVLKSATDNAKLIGNECCALARSLNITPQDYRGLGIQMSKLESVEQDKSVKTMKSFLCQSKDECPLKENTEQESKEGIFSPKDFNLINKPTLEKGTIKHFLSNQATSEKKQYNPADYIPEQFDQSVLNALPEDLKKEILDNYASKKTTSSDTTLDKEKYAGKLSSLKQSSNRSPPKGDQNNYPVKISETEVSRTLLTSVSSSTLKEEEAVSNNKPFTNASLGGAVELNDIRDMLKEWIESTQEPLEEDVDDLKTFLFDAIDEDISKVKVLLGYIHRLASSENACWKGVYLKILSCVQQKVVQICGSPLDVHSKFPT